MFKKILIANRGEIAVRVIRAAKELGIKTVAVYSEADANALFVYLADEAYCIGPGPAKLSYLQMDKLIELAKKTGAEAIHPGYGFLAENAEFVRKCDENGIVFIGPPAKAQELLGDKLGARRTMKEAGIPIVPGALDPIEDEKEAMSFAKDIGFPVIVKPVGGGGGIGMQVCRSTDELAKAIKTAQTLSASAFGRADVYIEKYVEKPRHVEVQILADSKGNVIHLGERECSIQRRHQKLIEIHPSPVVDDETRKRIGEIACKAAKVAGYVNAGTVEMLYSPKDNEFYFLEVNARIQVEHPVTELVTGVDIVKEGIKIAAGEPLSYKQSDIHWFGAAIECRINAEDPANNFLPSVGTITKYIEPGGPGVRVDSGVYESFTVPPFYDPLIAKLLVWGRTWEEAVIRMRRALDEYVIEGIKTNIPFHKVVMEDEAFIRGELSTEYIADRNIIQRTLDFLKQEEEQKKKKEGIIVKAAPAPKKEAAAPAGVPITDRKTVAIATAIASYMTKKAERTRTTSGWVLSGRMRYS
ncbi:MAG: acetyl-CoA carboxylase biotin carboxylase subunit [Candidatus Verstraetearchaeota archaeon]|nr:acetyl-CoA carboxylase biotin carboxylase subunit [Candidatus Verstraetearchaeota archaeon]